MQRSLLVLFVSLFFFSSGYGQAPAGADVSVRWVASPGPYFQHNFLTLTFTVANNGPAHAGKVVVSNLLPASLILVDASTQVGRFHAATKTYTLDALNAGATAELVLVARINSPAPVPVSYTVAVAGEAKDPNPGNNTVFTTIPVSATPAAFPDLAISKSISPGPYAAGDLVKYTLAVTNTGTLAAANVVVTDLFPRNLTLVSAPGPLNAGNNTISISLAALPVNETRTFEITATINTAGGFSNIATVATAAGQPVDANNTNNADTVRTCVLPAPPARLEINNSALIRRVCSGQAAEFKVPVVSGAVHYRYTFPPGFTVVRQLGSVIRVMPGQEGGEVTVTAVSSCGDSPVLRVPVSVSAIPPAPPAPAGPVAPCSGTEAEYTVPPDAGTAAYAWTLPADWTLLAGGTTASVKVQVGSAAGEVVVKAANSCGVGYSAALPVNPAPAPALPVIADSSSTCAGLRYAVAAGNGAAAYTWAVPAGWTIASGQGTPVITVNAPDGQATGEISVVARQGNCDTPPATYQAAASRGDGALNLPNAFSPNGDNQNDTYVIGNLEKYPDNDILVINRWGNQVFRQVGYQNNWAASGLNEGVYFYTLRVKVCQNEQKIYRGYITIAR
jgi:uncharacterized repeat protein (TIGR01451 family)/gliding motility-associated-like protein